MMWHPEMHVSFTHMAQRTSEITGKPLTFLAAFGTIMLWACTGPLFHYSDTWQLVINTGTTIITFLMVFLIQATQNRDAQAIQAKLDELIKASAARNEFIGIDKLRSKQGSHNEGARQTILAPSDKSKHVFRQPAVHPGQRAFHVQLTKEQNMATKTHTKSMAKPVIKHVQEDLFLVVYRILDVVNDARMALKTSLYEKADERMSEIERMAQAFLDTHR
jgi:low affinity Fe/Cu permease